MRLKASLSTGIHNLISNRPPRTERLLSLYLITVISLMSVALFLVMTQGLKKDLRSQYLESNSQKAINLSHQINRFLNTRRLQLADQLDNAVVKQAIMDPNNNQGLIRDYFSDQSIIGKKYQQEIYDFKGDIVFSSLDVGDTPRANETKRDIISNSEQVKTQRRTDLFRELLNEEKAYDIALDHRQENFEISLPIRYGSAVEGIMLAHIPIEEMVSALDLNNVLGINIKASSSNGRAIVWGNSASGNWIKVPTDPSTIQLAYTIDMSSLDASFSNAKRKLIFSALAIAVIAIGFAIVMGRWFFVRPLNRLQDFAAEISEGADPHLEKTKYLTEEIQELSDKITDMAKKIHRREHALMESNETLKNNQSSLVHAEKMAGLGQVTAGVAHEINNPIGFIMNNLSMLKDYHKFLIKLLTPLMAIKTKLELEQPADTSSELEAIKEILTQDDLEFILNDLGCITDESIAGAERVKEITNALKGYAYSGEKVSLVDINECIESTLKMVWNELKYNITVEKSLAQLPQIKCMGGQINQVLLNLFINAAHAVEGKQGTLQIKTFADHETISIEVSDNGCGIKPENLQHIFEPFFTTKPVGKGTGLGMSICYDIIKKHGGDIKVETELGVGTTFSITLPIHKYDE
jgi:two-component system, NtrC family, sensor kinase